MFTKDTKQLMIDTCSMMKNIGEEPSDSRRKKALRWDTREMLIMELALTQKCEKKILERQLDAKVDKTDEYFKKNTVLYRIIYNDWANKKNKHHWLGLYAVWEVKHQNISYYDRKELTTLFEEELELFDEVAGNMLFQALSWRLSNIIKHWMKGSVERNEETFKDYNDTEQKLFFVGKQLYTHGETIASLKTNHVEFDGNKWNASWAYDSDDSNENDEEFMSTLP